MDDFTDTDGTRWRVVHWSPERDLYTVERARRFFRGGYRVVSGWYVQRCGRTVR